MCRVRDGEHSESSALRPGIVGSRNVGPKGPSPQRKCKSNAEVGSLEAANEVGSGPCGFLDIVDAASGRIAVCETVGENVSVGTNHTKQIIDRVGENLGARGRNREAFPAVKDRDPWGEPLENASRIVVSR
jgi:hypothetical protein